MSDQPGQDLERNYDLFIEEAISLGCVWGLESAEGWALCPSETNPELEVIPFWSQPEYAQLHCQSEWGDYRVIPVSLEELLEDWLPGMHEDIILIGPNWNAELEGLELEPLDVLEDFDSMVGGD